MIACKISILIESTWILWRMVRMRMMRFIIMMEGGRGWYVERERETGRAFEFRGLCRWEFYDDS